MTNRRGKGTKWKSVTTVDYIFLSDALLWLHAHSARRGGVGGRRLKMQECIVDVVRELHNRR